MTKRLSETFAALLLLSAVAFSQTPEKKKPDEISPELTKAAVAFLRETAVDVNTLQTLENRISFSAELAGLMWYTDEKEARTMFQSVINDFRQLLLQYDSQISAAGITPTETSIFLPDESSTGVLSRKFTKAIAVRRQITLAIAEHDPPLAYEFFNGTAQVISNPDFRKQIARSDSYFETQLLQRIAENDVDLALKYAVKSLDKGLGYQTIGLLQKIYLKDADKGASFGEAVLSKLKSDPPPPDELYIYSSLMQTGAANSGAGKANKTPMFSKQSMRELAELFAAQILKRDASESSEIESYIPQIEKYAASRTAQIRQKFGIKAAAAENKTVSVRTSPPPPVPVGAGNENSPESLIKSVENLNSGKMSKEERETFVMEAKKQIAQIKDPTQKLFALSALAAQIAKSGDKETALQIMEETRFLIVPQPKNYLDFLKVAIVASGYSEVDASKSFPLLEDSIFRVNDLLGAAIKIAEFVDVNGDFIQDGEIQVGGFGGEITRELLKNLGPINSTIKNLVIADFPRTKALTNKFDRVEVRILAKMLVIRSIFGKYVKDAPEIEPGEIITNDDQ